jgi:phage gp16-like protein
MYRFLLQERFDTDSAKNLSHQQLGQFVSELATYKKLESKIPEQNKLIFSLWSQLLEQGKIGSGSRQSLNRWIKRQSGVERIEWLKSSQKMKLIEALKTWVAR